VAAINGDTQSITRQGGKNMLKKLFVTVAAAAAVSVSLVGVAGADPAPDNPGVPGNIPDPTTGISPGSVVSGAAKQKGSVPEVWSTGTGGQFRNPGQNLKDCCVPPNQPSPPEDPTPTPEDPTPTPEDPTPTPDTGGGDDTSSPGGTGEDTGSSPSSGGSDTGGETSSDTPSETSSR
jgi:hypothetical protein